MASICLVACASSKKSTAAPAKDLYTSALLHKSRLFAEKRFDRWYILSAKHGLVSPDQTLKPYDRTLKRLSHEERQRWAQRTFEQLLTETDSGDDITLLAGASYRAGLSGLLEKRGHKVFVPTTGMSIGKQLQWLERVNSSYARLKDLDRFYGLLRRLRAALGGGRELVKCTGALGWPERGVYFFFEPGEIRATRPGEPRVVRVALIGLEGSAHTP